MTWLDHFLSMNCIKWTINKINHTLHLNNSIRWNYLIPITEELICWNHSHLKSTKDVSNLWGKRRSEEKKRSYFELENAVHWKQKPIHTIINRKKEEQNMKKKIENSPASDIINPKRKSRGLWSGAYLSIQPEMHAAMDMDQSLDLSKCSV